MRAQIVSFYCVLSNRTGKVISSTFNRDVITHLEGQTNQLTGLIEGLQNLKKGEKRRIAVGASDAYGFYDPHQVIEFSRKALVNGDQLQVGDEFVSEARSGERKTYRVVRAGKHTVTLDANHPLAGQDLVFEIVTTSARDATREEIEESRMGDLPAHLH